MVPPIYNLPDAYRGDSYGPFSFYFSSSGSSGIQPLDLNGFSAAMQFRNKKTKDVSVSWLSSDNTILVSGSGVFIEQKGGEAMEIDAGSYEYDLQLSSGNFVRTYLRGEVSVLNDVTDIS